jgi:hypothetical protein
MTGLLGREGEARWRIASGVWTGRVFAMLMVAPVLAKIFFPGRGGRANLFYEGGLTVAAAIALLGLSEWLKRGSRVAAVLLLASFIALKLALWYVGAAKLWDGALVSAALIFGFIQGIWGASMLASVRRDRAASEKASGAE